MPDITMCASTTCNRRTECYRNAASGTEPNPWRQAYFVSTDMTENGCDKYSPKERIDRAHRTRTAGPVPAVD
jgi:hypothetical protein